MTQQHRSQPREEVANCAGAVLGGQAEVEGWEAQLGTELYGSEVFLIPGASRRVWLDASETGLLFHTL